MQCPAPGTDLVVRCTLHSAPGDITPAGRVRGVRGVRGVRVVAPGRGSSRSASARRCAHLGSEPGPGRNPTRHRRSATRSAAVALGPRSRQHVCSVPTFVAPAPSRPVNCVPLAIVRAACSADSGHTLVPSEFPEATATATGFSHGELGGARTVLYCGCFDLRERCFRRWEACWSRAGGSHQSLAASTTHIHPGIIESYYQ